jgi:hypothetical protein
MNSYFEIGGEIIDGMELNNQFQRTQGQSVLQTRKHSQANRDAKRMLKQVDESYTSLQSSLSGDEPDRTLFQHLVKTTFHPLSEFAEISTKRKIGMLQNPYVFGVWGIGKQLEVVGMHYDYFID